MLDFNEYLNIAKQFFFFLGKMMMIDEMYEIIMKQISNMVLLVINLVNK